MNVYTEYMLASLFNVTTTSPFECNLNNPVPVKGRKSYRNAMAVSIRVAENKAIGPAVSLMVLVDGHYRKIQWRMLSDSEKNMYSKSLRCINAKTHCRRRYIWQWAILKFNVISRNEIQQCGAKVTFLFGHTKHLKYICILLTKYMTLWRFL